MAALWAQLTSGWIDATTAVIEAERERGAALPGVPARDLAIALGQMNERVLHATFRGETPSVAEDDVLEVLLAVWLTAVYGTPDPPG